MTVVGRFVSVAVFNCGYTAPEIQKQRGQYHEIFDLLLRPALERYSARAGRSRVRMDITGWDSMNQIYPPTLDGIDAIIITGSPSGAYEDLEWIKRLAEYVSYVYLNHPAIKLYGSCFGHQIVAKALLSSNGTIVEKDPAGWELGVQEITLSDQFVAHFDNILPRSKTLRLQFLHGDHVRLSGDSLPGDTCLVGATTHCQNQGIYQPGRIFTLQGHPEFDQFIATECLKLVGKRVKWKPEFTEAAMGSARREDDAALVADIIMEFLLE